MPFLERTWLLEAMKAKDWDRVKLASETKIKYPRICEYIRGERCPRPERAIKIAKALGIDWRLFFENTAS